MPEIATSPPAKPTPVGEAGQYAAIDNLLEAAGVPPDGDASDLDKVIGDREQKAADTQDEEQRHKQAEADEKAPEQEAAGEEEEEVQEQEAAGEEEEAGADASIDGAELLSYLGLGDADPDSFEFNEAGELLVPTKVDGEAGKATVKDLVKGYQLNRNLTHKSEELAQVRQVVEQERAQLHSTLDQAIAQAGQLAKNLRDRVTAQYENTDWAKMEAEHGPGMVALRRQEMAAEYQSFERDLNESQAMADKSHGEQQARQAGMRDDFIRREAENLIEALPDFADAEKAPALQKRMRGYLTDKGLTAPEIANIIDHRQLSVIHDAMQWREHQKDTKKTIKKVVKTPRIRRAGSPRGKSEVKREQRSTLMGRVRKSGSEFDAGRAMLDLGLVDDV